MQEFALEPVAVFTSCCRGYHCTYKIVKEFMLEDLDINTKDVKYPEISGVKADCGYYKKMHHLIKFTAKILLGRNFLREYYIHMGFQPAWAYNDLIELVIKDGSVISEKDFSDKAKELREKIKVPKDIETVKSIRI